MPFVLDAFQLFLQNISLPDSQLASAQRSNNALRSFLESDDYFGRLTVDTFLNGSYARRTAVPIEDVDVIVVVDTDHQQQIRNTSGSASASLPSGTRTGEHGVNGVR